MKKFILHIILFSSAVLGIMFYILSLADGYSDSYYLKLATPEKTNLIIGTSKAAQGIQPHILKESLHKEFYNYAFAIYASPYGEVYLNSIKAKLDKRVKDNLFIVTIDAWSICSNNEDPDNLLKFRENKFFLHDITNVCQNPNLKYLIKYFEGQYYTILFKKSSAFLHDNGWLEVSLDENGVKRRTEFTMKDYQDKINYYHFSNTRFLYLLKTIDFLNQYGKVYLVRLPVHPDLKEIEDTLMPKFDQTIQPAKDKATGYLDLTILKKDLKYTDGVHLNKSSGEQVSGIIAKWIKDL